jgi:hypothetical protein
MRTTKDILAEIQIVYLIGATATPQERGIENGELRLQKLGIFRQRRRTFEK